VGRERVNGGERECVWMCGRVREREEEEREGYRAKGKVREQGRA